MFVLFYHTKLFFMMNTWRHEEAFGKIIEDSALRRPFFVKKYRWLTSLMAVLLLFSTFPPTLTSAKEHSLQDESIYDLLVDRFFNGNFTNDEGTDVKDMAAFSGGDFAGIAEKVSYLEASGFTLASIGPVFETATYDGNEVLSYETFEPHFGTEDEFVQMIKTLNEKKIGTIVDFPLNGISDQHEWIQDGSLATASGENGVISWDAANEQVQTTLKQAIVEFAGKYDLAGIRLTHLGDFDEVFLNEVITELKAANENLYVLTNEASNAEFDTAPNMDKIEALRQSFVQIDPDSSSLSLFEDQQETDLIQLDSLTGRRLTDEMVELQMFPPTRWKIASTALFTLPGVPVLPYESEIAVTGKEAPETHPIVNFKTDTELYDFISDLNTLRNKSETLRNGNFEILHNEDGFTVYTRKSDEETWVIALNNTSKTQSLEIDESVFGEGKKLRGLLQQELVRQGKDGKYRVVLEREISEVYIMDEDTGYNTPYLIVTILIYTSFFGLLFMMIRRGKKKKAA